MALPGDVTTVTVSFGPYTDAEGAVALAGAKGKLFPVDPATGKRLNLVHVATGQEIIPSHLVITIGSDGTDSVGPIPHTDNAGLSTVGFAYRVEWDIASNKPSPGNKRFAVPAASGSTVDFDLLDVAAAVPGVLVPMGVSAGVADAAVSALLPGPSLTQAAFDGRYVRDTELDAQTAALVPGTGPTAVALRATSGTPRTSAAHPTAVKPLTAPVFTKAASAAVSIYWPYLVDESQSGGPAGFSLFYSSDHGTHAESGIFRARAANPLATFTDSGRVYQDNTSGTQTETPSIVWDDVLDVWIAYYHQIAVSGAIGAQTTCYATSPDLTTWTRQGIALDKDAASDPGDGHTGYFQPFTVAGKHYGYSLYSGENLGRALFALWRSDNRRTWRVDKRFIGQQAHLLDGFTDFAPTGALGTSGGGAAGFAADMGVKITQGSPIMWRGALWWIGLVGRSDQGGQVVPNRVVAAPLRPDLIGLAAPPVDITPPAQGWEGIGIDLLGNAIEYQGRLLMPYRAGGATAFGILEIQ